VERTPRLSGKAAHLLAACIAAVAVSAVAVSAPAASAQTPSVLSVDLDRPAVVERPVSLRVTAVDPRQPVSGMVVSFGPRGNVFGLSACRTSSGRRRHPPFAPGSAVTLVAPHTFKTPGTRAVTARLDSGGCSGVSGSVFQPLAVTPTRPGERAVPLLVGTPVPLPTGAPALPSLPGVGNLPEPPALPGLPARTALKAVAAHHLRHCHGAGRRVRGTAAARRAARKALLCLLNAERRARGLRALRFNARLRRAASGHSRSMVRRAFFAHVQPGGVGLVQRLRRVHWIPRRGGWSAGENIAFGWGSAGTPLAIHQAWMHSTAHRANILRGRFREVGFGLASGMPRGSRSRGITYTTDFGRR
jgi:uncharacterized protein YkwD